MRGPKALLPKALLPKALLPKALLQETFQIQLRLHNRRRVRVCAREARKPIWRRRGDLLWRRVRLQSWPSRPTSAIRATPLVTLGLLIYFALAPPGAMGCDGARAVPSAWHFVGCRDVGPKISRFPGNTCAPSDGGRG